MNLKESQYSYFEELGKKRQIFAKTDGTTLQEHAREVLHIAIQLLKRLYIYEGLKSYEEKIKCIIKLIAYIHDAGKATKRWQQDIIKDGKERSVIPHPLFSLPIAKEYLERYLKIDDPKIKEFMVNLGLIAIACHHSPISNDKYAGFKAFNAEYIFRFQSNLKPYEIFDKARHEIIISQSKDRRYLYALTNGILTLADWIASTKSVRYKRFDTIGLETKISSYFKKEIKNPPYSYQNSARNIPSDLIIQLPTGKGKTETAIFWLLKKETNKVFYTLPTVTTVEAMRKRFRKIFDQDEVTFSHYLLELSLAKEEQLTEEDLFINRHLMSPVVITTIDRLLLTMMNFKRYPVVEAMLNNASIIIDEIHSYSPFTFSLIIETLRYLKKYHNVKFCIMSATLPKIIKEELQKDLEYKLLFRDEEVKRFYSRLSRTRIGNFYKGELLENNLDIIKDATRRYQKVLVVVNTVSRAQYIFSKINVRDTKKILFHSRFTYGDRLNKQADINKIEKKKKLSKVLLIATQIVEVSLDIDFDVLFTEIAPIDALIQRAGRVNRKGVKGIRYIYIFDVNDEEKGFLPYTKEQIEEARGILNGAKVKNEMDYLEMNEEFYKKIAPLYKKELAEDKLKNFLTQLYEKGNINKALQTRDGFLTIPVIPICFEEEIKKIGREIEKIKKKIKKAKNKQDLKNEKLNLIAKRLSFFVPITFYNMQDTIIQNDIPFTKLNYDSQKGIIKKEIDKNIKSGIII